jgi:N-acetylmuramoyl-L-alanine amidase
MGKYSRFFLDLGHGLNNQGAGKYDSGAISGFDAEHTLVAGVAEACRYALENQFDVEILEETSRSGIVEQVNRGRKQGDYLLSLHLNSSSSSKATGTEVIYGRNAPEARIREAALVSAKVAECLRTQDRGAKPDEETPNGQLSKDGLIVLTKTLVPALLIEFCFISNPKDKAAFKKKGSLALCETIRLLAKL